MILGFYGGAQTVTGSKHLITTKNGRRILLDCGMFQGEGPDTGKMNRHFGFDPRRIDYLILSHAHIDHSGLIPALINQGFRGKIFSTPATRDLCRVMLTDSAEIQEEDARRDAKKTGYKENPLYTAEDVKRCMQMFRAVRYNESYRIEKGITLTFTDAGHIIGSAAVNLEIIEDDKPVNITFTGDIGRYDRNLLCDPQPFPQADYIICESTYGNSLHQPLDEAEESFKQAILETCGLKKGKLIVPAFSLGRTQDFIYMLNKWDFTNEIPQLKVFVDSPLAIEATEVVRKHPECFDSETQAFMREDPEPFDYSSLHFIEKVEDSMRLNDIHEPCIIIASSGMMEAGRIIHHVIHHIEDPRNTIMLASYMPPGSLGGRLRRGDKKVEIWDRLFDVKADVITIEGLSAHADQQEILRYLDCQDKTKVKKVFLVHGEGEPQMVLKEQLLLSGFQSIRIPAKGEEFDTERD